MAPAAKKARTSGAGATGPDTVLVMDYGSQYTQLITRRVRELGVYSVLIPGDADMVRFVSRFRCAPKYRRLRYGVSPCDTLCLLSFRFASPEGTECTRTTSSAPFPLSDVGEVCQARRVGFWFWRRDFEKKEKNLAFSSTVALWFFYFMAAKSILGEYG